MEEHCKEQTYLFLTIILDKKITYANLWKGRKVRLNIKIISTIFLIIVIFLSGFIYFEQTDEPLKKNDASDKSNNDTEKKYGYLPIFVIVGLLLVIWLFFKRKAKKNKEK